MITPRTTLLPWAAAVLVLSGAAQQAGAQVVLEHTPYSLTVEGYVNATGARNVGEDNTADPPRYGDVIDSELRLLGLAKSEAGLAFGPRVTVRASSGESVKLGERSLLAMGPYGRAEVGKRRGLPDVLTGYAPNNYQFVSAEFGPATGRSLDPDGGLQTSFLAPVLANQINPLTSLGITASFFFDESNKIIYVSPKTKGFLGGLSFSPDAEDGNFKQLVQAGLTYENYWDQNVLRVGGTYAYARGAKGAPGSVSFDDLDSFSAGATVTLDDSLTLGASFTYNGDTGLQQGLGQSFTSPAFGFAAGINYNTGPWTFGGFYQWARAQEDTSIPGADRLQALEMGLSYRLNTKVRLYGAGYFYRFRNEGGATDANRFDGSVFMLGMRLTL